MKKVSILALLILLLFATSKTAALASGFWSVQGSTAMESMTFPNGKGPVTLVLSFNRNNSCRPEVSDKATFVL